MPTTRSSSKQTTPSTSPSKQQDPDGVGSGALHAGGKRKAPEAGSPSAAKGDNKQDNGQQPRKSQKTIEQTLDNGKIDDSDKMDTDDHSKDDSSAKRDKDKTKQGKEPDKASEQKAQQEKDTDEDKVQLNKRDEALDNSKQDGDGKAASNAVKKEAEHKDTDQDKDMASAVHTDESRKNAEPSNVLEKGLIYFFFRGRVNISDPSSVSDIQRSYILLRPLPSGASLGHGAVHSGGKARILALPKKTLPKSHQDRFLCWVEEANASFDEIKKTHLDRNEYTTKSSGSRETPAAQPAAEGIYAITTTGRDSHLAYIITVPEPLGQVQKELGLASRGAFITSVRNPETSAPSGTVPDAKADYPKEIMEAFRGLRWGRLEPRHLDYKDTQFLLIGEHEVDKLEKSVKADEGDGTKADKNEPKEELEILEKEDEERIKSLKGDDSDAIFKDLGLSQAEFSKIKTEW